MAPTSGTSDDAAFEMLAVSAGIADIPVACEPMAACDVMVPTDATAPRADEPVPRTVVCGYWNAIAHVGAVWRLVVVLELAKTDELFEIFDQGPGELIESSWDRVQTGEDGEAVLRFSLATWQRAGGAARRFTALIPPNPEWEEVCGADVFALCLVDIDDESDHGNDVGALSWFVENDSAAWN